MGRKILFVTTDQQRYDALGCNGGTVARTPVVDGLAARGRRYHSGSFAQPGKGPASIFQPAGDCGSGTARRFV